MDDVEQCWLSYSWLETGLVSISIISDGSPGQPQACPQTPAHSIASRFLDLGIRLVSGCLWFRSLYAQRRATSCT